MRLENKTPREIMNMEHKTELAIQQTSKVLSKKSNEYSPLLRTTNPFIPLLSFLFILQSLASKTFHFKRKKFNVSSCQIGVKMISLQDFPCIVTMTVVRDRKILSQIVGFSGYRPLTNREKK